MSTDPTPRELDARLEEALARAPFAGVRLDEVTREAARRRQAEQEAGTQARELLGAAVGRLNTNPVAATRAKLAAEVALSHSAAEDDRELAIFAAGVALELVERDRDTAEAKLGRVRALCRDLLATGGVFDHIGRKVLETLEAPKR